MVNKLLGGVIAFLALILSMSAYTQETTETEGEEISSCVQKCIDDYQKCAAEVRRSESLNYFKCIKAKGECQDACPKGND